MIRPYYLLDTNIISEMFRPKPNPLVFKKLEEYEKLCSLPSTAWYELLFGVNIMASGKKRDYIFSKLVDDIQANYEIIQYDNHAARIHADIRSRLKEQGIGIDFQDSQIASIAVSNNMVLVTRNIKHFESIQKVSPLMLENWFE